MVELLGRRTEAESVPQRLEAESRDPPDSTPMELEMGRPVASPRHRCALSTLSHRSPLPLSVVLKLEAMDRPQLSLYRTQGWSVSSRLLKMQDGCGSVQVSPFVMNSLYILAHTPASSRLLGLNQVSFRKFIWGSQSRALGSSPEHCVTPDFQMTLFTVDLAVLTVKSWQRRSQVSPLPLPAPPCAPGPFQACYFKALHPPMFQ
ncbi:hypothetical protein QQF64_003153 [Cirrhinus molitorella]|uniref:Uncharacterized protein n=1 Tax=Cirrhinus molitorella TaxID=172907 RepID=A0ABR3MKG8_9TELE